MPNTATAKKALRQNIKRRARNLAQKSRIKNIAKSVKKAAAGGDLESAAAGLKDAYKAFDKAAKRNIISKNKAARLKSKLAKRLTRKAP